MNMGEKKDSICSFLADIQTEIAHGQPAVLFKHEIIWYTRAQSYE